MSEKNNAERRKSRRRPVLETFSLFVVVPKKGPHRLKVYDVSDFGMRFDADTEGESPTDFPIGPSEQIEVHFYLNQSLYLLCDLKVARIENHGAVRRIGAEFNDKSSKSYKAYLSFLQMLDAVLEEGRVAAS
jgi:hypothetical protein